MKPNPGFQKQPPAFWATVKLVSERLGYSERGRRGRPKSDIRLKRYSPEMVRACLRERGLNDGELASRGWDELLASYSEYRAKVLEDIIRPALMNREQAEAEFNKVHGQRSKWQLCRE